MKIHSSFIKIVIFCSVFLFFVLPPIFTKPDFNAFSGWHFPILQFILFLFTLFLFFISRELWKKTIHTGKPFAFYDFIFPATFCLCVLFCISFFCNGIAILTESGKNDYIVTLPSGIIEWLFCIMTFIFSASYEEILYRFYLPEAVLNWIDLQNAESPSLQGKIFVFLTETVCAILFASAHFYAGIFAVINAFFAHFVLRRCYKKTGFIGAGISAHLVYNLVQLFLSQL